MKKTKPRITNEIKLNELIKTGKYKLESDGNRPNKEKRDD